MVSSVSTSFTAFAACFFWDSISDGDEEKAPDISSPQQAPPTTQLEKKTSKSVQRQESIRFLLRPWTMLMLDDCMIGTQAAALVAGQPNPEISLPMTK